ncbi:MAG TPA: spore maturation protein [Clostridia bacterium]|nr:spore maturation protein [Clostridia bacterium]
MDYSFFTSISLYALPVLFLLILGTGLSRKVKVYDAFVEGAAEGLKATVRILPPLVGLLTAVGVFRASGALDFIIQLLLPAASLLGIPAEAMPLALMRPVSGSASLALVSDIVRMYGPDSYIGRVVSTMMGSTETIFYTLAVYYGAVGIKNIRYTLAAALFADGVSVIASAWICALVFGR